MIRIKIGDELFDVPTSWAEVSVRQFMALRQWNDRDFCSLLSILSGASREEIFACKNIDLDEQVIPRISFVEKPIKDSIIEKQRTIMINGKRYPIPTDLDLCTFGQKLALQEKMAHYYNTEKSTVSCIPIAVAIYMFPIVTGNKYSTADAEKFMDDFVMDCPIVEAWSVANFFLRKLIVSQNVIQPSFPLARIRNKKLRALMRWMYSVILRQSTRWPGAIYSNMKM